MWRKSCVKHDNSLGHETKLMFVSRWTHPGLLLLDVQVNGSLKDSTFSIDIPGIHNVTGQINLIPG